MRELLFYIVDVFAEKKYTGNQLAVFRKAEELSDNDMQKIAREMNFSESAFILADEKRAGGFDVRIFTPEQEVPFAGHPTLGCAHIIHNEILKKTSDNVVLNLKAGNIPVHFASDGYAWMKQLNPVFGPRHSYQDFEEILGLNADDMDRRFPIMEVSTGLPFFIVALKNLAALKKASVNRLKYFDYIENTEAKAILTFCPESHLPGNDISVRVFVDCYGIAEDPATGSANGCLAGYLVKYDYFGKKSINIRSEQGFEIGRPSLLLLKATRQEEKINILVGGKSILIAKGNFL